MGSSSCSVKHPSSRVIRALSFSSLLTAIANLAVSW
jgi:hypothetical protein